MLKPDLDAALVLVRAWLKDARTDIGPPDCMNSGWWARRQSRLAVLAARLEGELGARVNDRWDGCRVRIAGLSASSTSGLEQALNNWIVAAGRRLGAGS